MPIPKNFASPIRMSAKERAFSQLQRWIIEGTLLPGEKLLDAELAESLAVSRTPIREALQLLEVQGLVSMHPGKETRVTMIEKDDILKMYPVLAALHALAAEQAAMVATPEQLEALRERNALFERAIRAGQPFQAMEEDEAFHNLIVEVSDSPYVASFSASLQVHVRRFKYVFLKEKLTASLTSVEEHAEVIAALEAHNTEKAAAAMKRNILRPMNELHALLL
ncbi:GntR family transcriptional regulator [Paenibacillus sp. GD4]|uniref:GntR family transcriptional regulator n=1 Tax=Paenibacillus sp. GD4 TaxID=3068890 RepID=UPI0027964A29|nr:GntR family transcriptional regulator [Paenibacillus sp. GD4]MDQ1911055.1 GntR family transcriptional regulator [Paenibacillus sp. GD4]